MDNYTKNFIETNSVMRMKNFRRSIGNQKWDFTIKNYQKITKDTFFDHIDIKMKASGKFASLDEKE